MKPKYQLGQKLYLDYYGWVACWAFKWFYRASSNSIVYSVSCDEHIPDLRYAHEDELITSREYQERLNNGLIRIEVINPIGDRRYLVLMARNGYLSESSN